MKLERQFYTLDSVSHDLVLNSYLEDEPLKTADEKAVEFIHKWIFYSSLVGELSKLLEEQDCDTRHACMKINPQSQLWYVCKKFVEEQQINCPETIHQCDWVIENAYSFIEEICAIVGYLEQNEGEIA